MSIMEKKALLRLVVVLVGLSCVVYAAAVPATRSHMIRTVNPSVQDHLAEEDLAMVLRKTSEVSEMMELEQVVEGRMIMDIADYPGTRANPGHEPKSPRKPN